MNAIARNALDAYSQVGVDVSVATASPHRLIMLLFDGAIKAISKAKFHMEKNEIAPKGEAISKAIAIIDQGLNLSLDKKVGGELAENLGALYEYMCHRLLTANLKNDVSGLDEVNILLSELRGAWAAIERNPETLGAGNQLAQPTRNQAVTSYGRI